MGNRCKCADTRIRRGADDFGGRGQSTSPDESGGDSGIGAFADRRSADGKYDEKFHGYSDAAGEV